MSPTATTRGEWRALLRRPGYAGFVATVSASRIVAMMFTTAGVLLVLDRTQSAALAGATTAAAMLPGALLAPWLGALIDVAERRRALIVADQLLSVVALVAIVLLAGRAPDWTVPLAAVLLGLTRPFSVGSFVSALSALAGDDLLDRASAVEASSLNLSLVIGPALAGALAGAVGAARVIELQAALTVVVAAAIAVNPAFEARTHARPGSVREAVRVGTRALLSHRLLRRVAVSSLLANASWGLMIVVFPLWAAASLHTGRNASGYLFAALSVGSILGTFLLAGRPDRRRITVSCAAVAVSALLWPLAGSLPLAIGLVALTGLVEGPFYSGTIALRQRFAPGAARAQVLNTLASLGMVSSSVGSLVGGLIADPSTAFLAFVAINLVAAAVIGAGPTNESAPVPAGYEAGLGARSREERYCGMHDDTRA